MKKTDFGKEKNRHSDIAVTVFYTHFLEHGILGEVSTQ